MSWEWACVLWERRRLYKYLSSKFIPMICHAPCTTLYAVLVCAKLLFNTAATILNKHTTNVNFGVFFYPWPMTGYDLYLFFLSHIFLLFFSQAVHIIFHVALRVHKKYVCLFGEEWTEMKQWIMTIITSLALMSQFRPWHQHNFILNGYERQRRRGERNRGTFVSTTTIFINIFIDFVEKESTSRYYYLHTSPPYVTIITLMYSKIWNMRK